VSIDCASWFGAPRCKFEARYDTIPPDRMNVEKGSTYAITEVIRALTTQKYVQDVCVKCGKVVNRHDTTGERNG
jgi:hypothetical protein